jgi:hypothetical protein
MKPFAGPGGYTPPPAVSPYLGLFTNAGRGVDPYSVYVQPVLQQQQRNSQFNSDINALQNQTDQLLAPARPQTPGMPANGGYINPQVNPNALPAYQPYGQ